MVLQVPQGIRRAINKKNKRPVFRRLKLTDVEKETVQQGRRFGGSQEKGNKSQRDVWKMRPSAKVQGRRASLLHLKKLRLGETSPAYAQRGTEGMCRAPSRQFPNKGPDLLVKY